MLESKVRVRGYEGGNVQLNDTDHLEFEARLALAMIEHWGQVAGMPDGETASGRPKLRLATPEELVERAFTCARIGMERARAEGLIHNGPTLADIEKAESENKQYKRMHETA